MSMKSIFLDITAFTVIVAFTIQILISSIIDVNIIPETIILLISIFALIGFIVFYYHNEGPFIAISIVSILFFVLGARLFELLGMFIVGIPFLLKTDRVGKIKYTAFSLLLLSIMALSGALRVGDSSGMLIFSIYDDIPGKFVPLLFQYGIVLSMGSLIITVSPFYLTVVGFASYFATENTSLIISRFRKLNSSGILQIVPAIASCQCEATLGISAYTATIFSLLLTPLIIISIIFLAITNLLLRGKFKIKMSNQNWESIILMGLVAVMGMMALGSLSFNIGFYLLFSSLLTGFFMIIILRYINYRISLGLFSVFLAIVFQGIALTPYILHKVTNDLFSFSFFLILTSISSIFMGLYKGGWKNYDSTVYEIYFSMWVMASLIILLFQENFNLYNMNSLFTFLILLLIISLPAMWISNLYNLRSFRLIGNIRS